MKKISLILALCLLVSSLSGCGLIGSVIGNVAGDVVSDVLADTTKTFSNNELSIDIPVTMSDVSSQTEFKGFDLALANDKVAIIAIKESRSDFETGATMTVETYTDLVLQANQLDKRPVAREGKDYLYFTFDATSEGMNFRYLGATFAADDCFWFVQVYSLVSDFDQSAFLGYLDTLVIK